MLRPLLTWDEFGCFQYYEVANDVDDEYEDENGDVKWPYFRSLLTLYEIHNGNRNDAIVLELIYQKLALSLNTSELEPVFVQPCKFHLTVML